MKTKTIPVIFRFEVENFDNGSSTYTPVAFFPTVPFSTGPKGEVLLTCYSHVGQHGAAQWDYMQKCPQCNPWNFEELLNELRGIYETGPDAVKLRVIYRPSVVHRRKLVAA